MPRVETFGPPKKLPKVRYTDYYEGVDRTPCTITLPTDMLEELIRFGMRVGVTHNALVALALDRFLRAHGANHTREDAKG